MANFKVYFEQQDIATDVVVSIGQQMFTGNKTAADICAAQPSLFWLDINSDGEQRLCTFKNYGQQLYATFATNNGNYMVQAKDQVMVDIQGTPVHPVHRPK